MSSKKKEKRGLIAKYRTLEKKKRILLAVIAAVLAVAILGSLIYFALPKSPVVMRYGTGALREDAYSYWFSCYKYRYLVAYKQLGIEDSELGWAEIDPQSGKSYDEAFKEAIDKEISLRFIASVLFDKATVSLTDTELAYVESTLEGMEEYSYGEPVYEILEERYGVGKRELKRVALYELKYKALLSYRFGSDFGGVYSEEHRLDLEAFYRDHYKRFNFVYLSDKDNAKAQKDLREFIASGITEAAFTEWEREYSESPVTESYPNGIYLYDGMSYNTRFSEELLSAFYSLEVGDTAEVRNAKDDGTYFVMRYELDEAPYLSSDKKIALSLEGFAEYAARSLYREELEECLADVEAVDELVSKYTPKTVEKEKDYNIVDLIG